MINDLFISHAESEEDEIAQELLKRLEKHNLKVWDRKRKIRLGQSIIKAINDGLKSSRFGVIIISRRYLDGNGAIKELYALFHRESQVGNLILPVYHGITVEEIQQEFPLLADRFGVSTSQGLDYVVEKILESVVDGERQDALLRYKRQKEVRKRKLRWMLILSTGVVFCLGIILVFYYRSVPPELPKAFIRETISNRIDQLNAGIIPPYCASETLQLAQAIAYYDRYQEIQACVRSNYNFKDDQVTVNYKKNVRELGINTYSSPYDAYGFEDYDILGSPEMQNFEGHAYGFFACYTFLNNAPIYYTIGKTVWEGRDRCFVEIRYVQNVRNIHVNFERGTKGAVCKESSITYLGLVPSEIFEFARTDETWEFIEKS